MATAKYVLSYIRSEHDPMFKLPFEAMISKYEDSVISRVFESVEEFKQSDHWKKTQIVVFSFIEEEEFREVFENNPVEWVHSLYVGVHNYMIPDFVSSPVPLTNIKGANNFPIAEFCVAFMLYFCKKVPIVMEQIEEKSFDLIYNESLISKTVGILGYGSIGRTLAGILRAFHMNIIGFRRTRSEPDDLADQIVLVDEIKNYLPSLDYFVMILPNHPSSQNLIGAEEISLLKSSCVLVNVGRGNSLDEIALDQALRQKKLRGAVLDVFKEEPLPADSILWNNPRVIISPHSSKMSEDSGPIRAEHYEQYLKCFLNKKPFPITIDKSKGY